jgi:hypothetical protein
LFLGRRLRGLSGRCISAKPLRAWQAEFLHAIELDGTLLEVFFPVSALARTFLFHRRQPGIEPEHDTLAFSDRIDPATGSARKRPREYAVRISR